MSHVVIVGGGIAGLATAHALLAAPRAGPALRVTLLERDARVGGNIRTHHVDGFVCEAGPNGFLDNAPATLALVKALGLDDQRLPRPDAGRARIRSAG